MSLKDALAGLVDRMFRHADLDDAFGLDDFTKLERGLPLTGHSDSLSPPDFRGCDSTFDLAPAPDAPDNRTPGRPGALGPPPADDRSMSPFSVSGSAWLSKGWTVSVEREAPAPEKTASHRTPAPPTTSATDAPRPGATPRAPGSGREPRRLEDRLEVSPPPRRDPFEGIELLAVLGDESEASPTPPHGDPLARPPVRPTEEITV